MVKFSSIFCLFSRTKVMGVGVSVCLWAILYYKPAPNSMNN